MVHVSDFAPGPTSDMLLHYVSLCLIWLCLVKRSRIGNGGGGGTTEGPAAGPLQHKLQEVNALGA